MMWNSRVNAAVLAGSIAVAASAAASDAPAPALPGATPPVTKALLMKAPTRLVIAAVTIRALPSKDPVLLRSYSSKAVKALAAPTLVSVRVRDEFGNLARNASPVIILDGKPLPNSYVPYGVKDRVEAIVEDGRALKAGADIQVGWLGALETTTSAPSRASLK